MIENRGLNRYETQLENIYNPLGYGAEFDISNEYSGFLKCKLIHEKNGSIILPELLMVGEKEFDWILIFTFFLNFQVKDDTQIISTITIDIAFGNVVRLEFTDNDLEKIYPDNSSLFRCKINGPKNIEKYFTGKGYFDKNMTPFIYLYHHTTIETKKLITESNFLLGSKWNFQGTKELKNVNFIYFTCINKIEKPKDLELIAMSSNGEIYLTTDDFIVPPIISKDELLSKFSQNVTRLKVYRESTKNRTATLKFAVNTTNLWSPNLWFHNPKQGFPYYEVCNPYINRLGIESGSSVEIKENATVSTEEASKQSYLVIGGCSSTKGLEAPYDEEETKEIFKIEPLYEKINILKFWFEYGNRDLFSRKSINKLKF